MYKLLLLSCVGLVLGGCFDSSSDDANYKDVNSAPVANDLEFTTQTETPVTDTLSATDEDGDSLTFAVSTAPTLGSVSIADTGEFTYIPNNEVTGTDSFTFTVSDGQAFAVTGMVTITVEALQVSVSSAVRTAFTKAPSDEPVSVNGRDYTQDAEANEFDDLLID